MTQFLEITRKQAVLILQGATNPELCARFSILNRKNFSEELGLIQFKEKNTPDQIFEIVYKRNKSSLSFMDIHDYSTNLKILSQECEFSPEQALLQTPQFSTDAEKADQLLWSQYYSVEKDCKKFSEDLKIKKEDWRKIKDFFKVNKQYSLFDLRALIIPVCIKYKIEHVSFWREVQRRVF